MNAIPTDLQIIEDKLQISWSDGQSSRYAFSQLREACPCATCREKRKEQAAPAATNPLALPVLSAEEARPLTIEGMQPVGNYAYSIHFSDGHDTGIYTFTFLRQLGSSPTNDASHH